MSIANDRPTKGAAAKAAREKARLNRARLDAERERRDERIEAAASEFFELAFDAEQLREQLEAVEARRGVAVRALRELGEKDQWIGDLLETDAKEVARLAKLPAPSVG